MMKPHKNLLLDNRSRRPGPKREASEARPISTAQLLSCYGASVLIVVFSLLERSRRIREGVDSGSFYILLAVIGVVFSCVITLRQVSLKKKPQTPSGKGQRRLPDQGSRR